MALITNKFSAGCSTINGKIVVLCFIGEAMKTKYVFGSLEILLCSNNNDTNFIANFKQIIEILKKAYEAVVTF